jgi:hypothetical protein
MRARPTPLRILFVAAVFTLVFGVAGADAATAAPTPAIASDRHAAEVGATHAQANEAGVTNAGRLRRFAPFGVVLGTLLVVVLWLSWPCATRVFRARPIVARFSIRRRGPPAFLAAA